MPSIKHSLAGNPLPDFRNLGVISAFCSALTWDWLRRWCKVRKSWTGCGVLSIWPPGYSRAAFNLLLLALVSPLLLRLPVWGGQIIVVGLAAATSVPVARFWRFLGLDDGGWSRSLRAAVLGASSAGAVLFYFSLRARAFSPAITEARLQAQQRASARIFCSTV